MTSENAAGPDGPPRVDVTIEIPRGSFLKRGSDGRVDFVSPFPCPFNYGSVRQYIGGEGDFLDAVVLGPRLPPGHRLRVNAYGAIGLSERHMYDDKLICAARPLSPWEQRGVLGFFHFYAFCKGLLNLVRRQAGRSRCEGWDTARAAIGRAIRVEQPHATPRVRF